MPIITVAMTHMRSGVSLSTVFLVYLLVVLGVGALGESSRHHRRRRASALENFYFVPPLHTLQIARPMTQFRWWRSWSSESARASR